MRLIFLALFLVSCQPHTTAPTIVELDTHEFDKRKPATGEPCDARRGCASRCDACSTYDRSSSLQTYCLPCDTVPAMYRDRCTSMSRGEYRSCFGARRGH